MITRLLLCSSTSLDPYRNLALEERLFDTTKPGDCVLYLWQNRCTVVIGRNQNARAQCRIEALERDGGHLARRLSGGGAVFHDLGNLNFTFLVRDPDYDVGRQLSVIAEAVSPFGLTAEVSGRNDVLADGRKFSGNAFYQKKDRHYHHGTLLVCADTAQMAKYLTPDLAKLHAKGVASVRSRVVNLQELCPYMTVDGLKASMATAFQRVYGLDATLLPEPPESELAERAAYFASFDWLLGREAPFDARTETRRFPWGCAQFSFSVEQGRIRRAVLSTDAMEPDLARLAEEAVLGAEPSRDATAAALEKAARKTPFLGEELRALAELFPG